MIRKIFVSIALALSVLTGTGVAGHATANASGYKSVDFRECQQGCVDIEVSWSYNYSQITGASWWCVADSQSPGTNIHYYWYWNSYPQYGSDECTWGSSSHAHVMVDAWGNATGYSS